MLWILHLLYKKFSTLFGQSQNEIVRDVWRYKCILRGKHQRNTVIPGPAL